MPLPVPLPAPLLAAFDATAWFTDHASLLVGVLVVIVGLAVVGRSDVARFSAKRVWAISGVCFAESIRRRVLWIIPLAIVGLVAVVQLQQPSDEQDAIRQTTKFCLLAAGLVVVLSTLILACTNLPREIESRVIFTVVTKPTTRLEIVLGKIVGFARVSFTILLVMGLFTWGYLHLRASLLSSDLQRRLDHNEVEAISRPTFTHYVQAGLLNAKTLSDPVAVNVYGRPPVPGSTRRYLNSEGYLLVPFTLPPNLIAYADPETLKRYAGPGLRLTLQMGYDPAPPQAAPAAPPTTSPATAPSAAAPAGPPMLSVQIFDPSVTSLLSVQQVAGGPVALPSRDGSVPLVIDVPVASVAALQRCPSFYVAISPANVNQPLWIDVDPARHAVQMLLPVLDSAKLVPLDPVDPADPTKAGQLTFTGRQGTYGQQVKGDPTATSQTCVFQFHDVKVNAPPGPTATVPIEMRVGIEKNGDTASEDVLTDMRLSVTDPATGRSADVPGLFHPENNRTLYASVPADLVRSGTFDVAVRCLSNDQWIGIRPTSLSVVGGESSFGLNLAKSLAVLWLLSILVTAISVFSSTFLSWPTAVVFTLVILFGRWGLDELGDAASAGLGRQFVTDFGVTDVSLATTLTSSVDVLNKTFKTVASVLPDIGSFSATDDIERGLAIPAATLGAAGITLLAFGLPLGVAAYVILKFKEVAP